MNPETQETLARTKAPAEKNEFADAVFESFRTEFGKVTQARIAKIVGWKDGSRVHQVISAPKSLDTGTIQTLIAPLKSKANKRRVIHAWAVVVFGQDYTDTYYSGRIPDAPTATSLDLVHSLMKEGRLLEASSVCLEIYQNATDHKLKEAAETRHFYARLHSNEVGWAMLVARNIVTTAKQSKDTAREAYGQLQTVRVLLELPNFDLPDALARLEKAQQLIYSANLHSTVKGHDVQMDYLEVKSRVTLRGAEIQSQFPELEVRELRETLVEAASIKTKNAWNFWIPLLAARASFMLGDRVKATDLLERARKQGATDVYHADPEIGLLYADILQSSGNRRELYEYLTEQSSRCFQRGDILNRLKFEQRIADHFKDTL